MTDHISENAAVRLWEDVVGDSGEAPTDEELLAFARAVQERIENGTIGELEKPRVREFRYYLHDNYSRSEFQEYLGDQGIEVSDELLEKIGRPFYEVTFNCTLDVSTGEVKIVDVKL